MTEIAVVLRPDGATLTVDTLHPLAEQLAAGRPRTKRCWVVDSVGFVLCSSVESSESSVAVRHDLPGTWRSVVVADCRLDNRKDLCRQLAMVESPETSDVDLIRAAYARWGTSCPRYLEGDFAFALWDPSEQCLLLARDVFGLRPLFYARVGPVVVAASTVGTVAAGVPFSPGINRDFLRDFLRNRMDRFAEETARDQIYRVPAAHTVVVRGGDVRVARYYRLGESPPADLPSADAHAERFEALLLGAVAARMRGTGPVGLLLSGGLDSASVACATAAAPLTAGRPLRAYSAWFDHTPGADEREHLQPVLDACPELVSTTVACDDCWAFREFGDDRGFLFDEPELDANRGLLLALLRRARADGCRIVLSGFWADQILASYAYSIPHFLLALPADRWMREWTHFHRGWPGRRMSFVPRMILGRAKTLCRPSKQFGRNGIANAIYRELTSGVTAARISSAEQIAASADVEWRVPFLDRALVEAALAVPPSLVVQEGETKSLLRRALKSRLPAATLARRSYGHHSHLDMLGLQRERSRLEPLQLAKLTVAEGLLSARAAHAVWTRCLADPTVTRMRQLTRLLSTEIWLRRHTSR